MGAQGLIAPEIPDSWAAAALDRLTSGLITEQIATGDFNVAYVQVVGSLVGQILAGNAQPEVAAQWVPKICSGEEIVGIGLSEPHAGSDAGNPRLRAVRDGDDFVLTGVKSLSFVPGCRRGGGVRPHLDEGAAAASAPSWSPLDQPGVTKEPYSDMGTKAVAPRRRPLRRCPGPGREHAGQEGQGFTQVMQGFDFSRALIGLQCIGWPR